jgi:hypothetical protein
MFIDAGILQITLNTRTKENIATKTKKGFIQFFCVGLQLVKLKRVAQEISQSGNRPKGSAVFTVMCGLI